MAQVKQAERKGLSAVYEDERLTDAERMQWVELCTEEYALGARVKAMYVQRQAQTPNAPSAEEYMNAHSEHMGVERRMIEMRKRFGGWIPYPFHV